ncbi:glycosyl transferase family 9 [Kribbella flavida DSM 17836]|uniref:Glycosyl transferase family 9 n=1 Tax=Kribbella flavida (strain DSM 17836 / JCM 10339 / NBRC 14399) TaxID=479435 RepID=D2PXF1_KRIFD|nr:glycosyltransferase family 9 protein [Kribbella flavida]ADB29799.1 glycosyl transferase family 9 [Kribbella flavida DSM 17836]
MTVLALRALGLGDALTGVPALRGLKRLYPDRSLVLAGSDPVSSWLQRLGVVDEVLATDGLAGPPPGRSVGPHTAVNLHGRGPQSHRLLLDGSPDELIALDCPDAGFRSTTVWRADEHEVERWCRVVRDAGGSCSPEDLRLDVPSTPSDAVLVHPGAASVARQWPPERWVAVVTALQEAGRRVMVTGGPAERELCGLISKPTGCEDVSGLHDLDSLAELVAGAALLISGDTGVAHLATAVGTASVTLFGPTPPQWWGPAIDPNLHTVLYHGTEPGDPHADRPDPALLSITVQDVLAAVSPPD